VSDAIAVLNAGSSSLKFSLFAERGNALELTVRGQVEGLHTAPRFVAKDRHGKIVGKKAWGDGVELRCSRPHSPYILIPAVTENPFAGLCFL
jgi:acetate kinase